MRLQYFRKKNSFGELTQMLLNNIHILNSNVQPVTYKPTLTDLIGQSGIINLFDFDQIQDRPPDASMGKYLNQPYNAAIRHFEGILKCKSLSINSGQVGLNMKEEVKQGTRGRTSWHKHDKDAKTGKYGQIFIALEGNAIVTLGITSYRTELKILEIEKGQAVYLPAGIFHQIHIPKTAKKPFKYLCVSGSPNNNMNESGTLERIKAVSIMKEGELTYYLQALSQFQSIKVITYNHLSQTCQKQRLLIFLQRGNITVITWVQAGNKIIITKNKEQKDQKIVEIIPK